MEKIFQIIQDLRFDISFADALLLMPRFAPTIKSLLMNIGKVHELAKMTVERELLGDASSKKLPEKLGDPGKFLIPCDFLGMDVCHALADLGAIINLMPFSIDKKLSLPQTYTNSWDFSLPKPIFVVVDFEADPRVPLILGRSFLRTSCALINVYEGELILRDENEQITFHVNGTSKHPQKHVNESIKMVNDTCKDSFKKFTDEPALVCLPPSEDDNDEKEKQEVKNLTVSTAKRQTRITPCLKNFKLSLPELTPTRMTLELADRSITRPKGLSEDVFVKVGSFHFPTDFVVVDFEADPRVPLILGRSFLRTGHALIDVYEGELILRNGDERLIFHVNKHPQKHANESIKIINFINVSCEDSFEEVLRLKKTNHPSSGSTTLLSVSHPSLTTFETSDSLLEEFADELALLEPFPPRNEDVNFETDLREIELLLNRDPSTDFLPKITIDLNPKRFINEPALVCLPLPGDDESFLKKDIQEVNFRIYSNPLFKFDDHYNSSDINPLFNETLEDVESEDSNVSNFDEDECFDPGGEIDKFDAFMDAYINSEGDVLEILHNTTHNLFPEVFFDHEPQGFKDEPDNDDLMTKDKGGDERVGGERRGGCRERGEGADRECKGGRVRWGLGEWGGGQMRVGGGSGVRSGGGLWGSGGGTDIAKIIRKRSKPNKHGHGKGKSVERAGDLIAEWSKS
ncbi:reverse transcriptase domain-containing protein [Tanacetum coccineum]